jgi:hypothetical protein
MSVCHEETIFEKLSKSSEAVKTLGDCISLDAGHWNSLDSGWADELEVGADVVQAQIPDSGGVWLAICILMVAAVIVSMENLENGTLHELNKEMNDMGQHTMKEPTTDARVITEGTWLIAFDAEACLTDVGPDLDDLGGSLIPSASFDDEGSRIYWCDKAMVNVDENFMFRREKDLQVMDLIVNEFQGGNGCVGLNPEDRSLDIVDEDGISFDDYTQLGKLTDVVDKGETGRAPQNVEVTPVVEEHRSWKYTGNDLCLDVLVWAVVLIRWLDGFAQAFKAKRDPKRSISYEGSWALCFIAIVNVLWVVHLC